MTAHKLKRNDPDDYEPAETIVLDDASVMDTAELRELIEVDPALLDEFGTHNQDD